MTGKMKKSLSEQTGAALVIALIMMIVLTLIGLAASYTSIFEIKLSGNKRGITDAFYAADGGAQAVLPVIDNFNVSTYTLIPNSGSLPPDLQNEQIDSRLTTSPTFLLPLDTFADPPDVTIYHTTRTGVPRGSGHGISSDFVFYLTESTGRDQVASGLFKSTSTVRQVVYRMIPKNQEGGS